MSINGKGAAIIASQLIFGKYASNKYAKSFINHYFYHIQNEQEPSNYLLNSNTIKHSINSFDNTKFNAYEIRNNTTENYVLLVHGFNQTSKDMEVIANGFDLKGYNIILIQNRNELTHGILESFDLYSWIYYFVNKYPSINITLYGENEGANIIIETLQAKQPNNIKCCILDNAIPNYTDKLIESYIDERKIVLKKSFNRSIQNALVQKYGYNFKDISLDKCIENNSIPLCFVYSKHFSRNEYYELLKLFNKTKGDHKFYFTSTIKRNYTEENYFDILDLFIKNYL